MTVSATTKRVSYTGDGVSTAFTITFGFYLSTDVEVLLGTSVQSSGYTITGGGGSTGTCTFSTAPANGAVVTLILNVPLTQLTSFVDGTAFPSSSVNQVNDRAIQAALRLDDKVSRSIHAPDGDVTPNMELPAKATRISKALMFDTNGDITVGTPTTTTMTQSSIGALLYPQTTAESAAGVTPVNYYKYYGDPERFQINSIPGTTDMATGLHAADLQSQQSGGYPVVPTTLLHIGTPTTLAGRFSAPNAQFFTKNSAVHFNSGVTEEINAVWFGASPSASSTDNSTAINTSLSALPSESQKWRLPDGLYLTNASISVPALNDHTIVFDGELKNTGGNHGIIFHDVLFSEVKINRSYRDLTTPTPWTDGKYAVWCGGYFESSKMYLGLAQGFTVGLGLDIPANTDVAYSEFHIGRFIDIKKSILMLTAAGSFVSDNTFFHVSTKNSTAHAAGGTGDWAIYLDPSSAGSPCNNNVFIRPSFEAVTNGVYAVNSNSWLLINPRFESTFTTALDVTATTGFTMIYGYGNPEFDSLPITCPSSARGFTVINSVKSSGAVTNRSFTFDVGSGGVSWQAQDTRSRADLAYDYSGFCGPYISSWQQSNYTNKLNKGFESSAAPTSGTWAQGQIVWNTTVATGNPIFFACSVFGTAGTLNGGLTTASTTSGSNVITVSSITGIDIGVVLTVAGGAGFTKRVVTSISGTAVTLSGAAASSNTSGQAVSYGNPTFISGPNYP